MKQTLFLIALAFPFISLFAQQDTVSNWTTGGNFMLQFNQSSFTNWAAGGDNVISLSGSVNLSANYKKGRLSWQNNLAQVYGLSRIGRDTLFRKVNDLFELKSKVAYQHTKYTYFTVFTDFQTQLSPGYAQKEPDYTNYTTNFFAPAYLTEGLGYEFREDSILFSLIVSPVSGKQTFVFDNGVDETDFGLASGQVVRNEFGANVKVKFEREVVKNVTILTDLQLFSNYLENPENIDVNWKTQVNIVANKYITMSLQTQLIYDDDIVLPTYEDTNNDGVEEIVGEGPKTQFMQMLGVGLSYKF